MSGTISGSRKALKDKKPHDASSLDLKVEMASLNLLEEPVNLTYLKSHSEGTCS